MPTLARATAEKNKSLVPASGHTVCADSMIPRKGKSKLLRGDKPPPIQVSTAAAQARTGVTEAMTIRTVEFQ
jgi:hypothetical protein